MEFGVFRLKNLQKNVIQNILKFIAKYAYTYKEFVLVTQASSAQRQDR